MTSGRPVLLALHGFGRTAEKHLQLDFWKGHQLLSDQYDIHYAEGAIEVPPEVLREMAGGGAGLPERMFTGNVAWFRANEGVYQGIEKSVEQLRAICAEKRPVGILGWSQGGLMALMLAAMSPGDPSLSSVKFVIAMGAPCTLGAKKHINEILKNAADSKVALPVMFWGSKRDRTCRYAESFSEELFDNATVCWHEETTNMRNHALPRKKESWQEVIDFCSQFSPK